MNFVAILSFAVFIFSSGIIFGSLSCVFCGKVFKKNYSKAHFTVIFFFLSILVFSGIYFFFFTEESVHSFSEILVYKFYFLSLFGAGFLFSSVWRVFPGLFLVLYIFLSVFTGVKFYSIFQNSKESINLTVNEQSIYIEDEYYPVLPAENQKLYVEVYELPKTLLLPLPRVWYKICGIVDLNENKRENYSIKLQSDSKKSGQNIQKTFFSKKLNEFIEWCLSSKSELLISIPKPEVFPAVYKIDFKRKGDSLKYDLNKIF